MTNRELIGFAKKNGFIDITKDEYATYDTVGGKMKQMCQKDYLTFEKKFGSDALRLTISNDKWSFDGLNDSDRISITEYVWFNEGLFNETNHKEGAILDVQLDNNSLVVTYRVRLKNGEVVVRTETIEASEEN